MPNLFYYGDNIDILRQHVKDETVDLIYLDPPFNSSQNYSVLFAEKTGSRSAAQIRAFEDTWHWDDSAGTLRRADAGHPAAAGDGGVRTGGGRPAGQAALCLGGRVLAARSAGRAGP